MKCPYCDIEMEKGQSSFMAVQGFAQMMLLYTSNEEAKNSILKRKTKDKVIVSGEEAETYYCSSCKKIIPIFDVE